MDLVTLVTACALAVDPKLMHALVWHQSGGEPWAISVQGEPQPARLSEHERRDQGDADGLLARHRARRPCGRPDAAVAKCRRPCSCRAATSRWRRCRSAGLSADASRIRASRATRRIVRLPSIGAPGSSRTSSSQPQSWQRRRKEMRRTSTCRPARARRFSTSRTSLRRTTIRPSSTSRKRSPSRRAAGPARCSRRNPRRKPAHLTATSPRQTARLDAPSAPLSVSPSDKSGTADRGLFVRRPANEPAQ